MLCLYRAGHDIKRLFTISEYYDRDRPAFYRALQGVREHGLSERQGRALGYVLKHGSIGIQEYEEPWPAISRRSLQRDLRQMFDRGLLLAEGATNKLAYRLKDA